jgi:hypothetical protein
MVEIPTHLVGILAKECRPKQETVAHPGTGPKTVGKKQEKVLQLKSDQCRFQLWANGAHETPAPHQI